MCEDDLRLELDLTIEAWRTLAYSPTAEPQYAYLQDAVFWEDEFPKHAQFECKHFLNHIFCFRIAAARANWKLCDPLWEYLKQQVPDWPGFRPERCDATILLTTYERLTHRWQW